MKLLVSQKNEVGRLIFEKGLVLSDFDFVSNNYGEQFVLKQNPDFLFMYRDSICGGQLCDIFYEPAKDEKSLYIKCDSFEESIPHIKLWLEEIINQRSIVDMWENNEYASL